MATLVDAVGILQKFGFYDTVFPFILIAAGMYAMLAKYKPFGDLKYINAIISIIIAFFFISLLRSVSFLKSIIPLITIFLIMLVLVILIFTFIGIKGDTMTEVLLTEPAAWGSVLVIFIIIMLAVISQTFPEASLTVQNPELAQQLNVTSTGTAQQQASAYLFTQLFQVIFSPQILGLVVLLLVFAISTYFITREPPK